MPQRQPLDQFREELRLVDLLGDPDPGDLARLAADQLHAGAETSNPDQLTTAAVYALVSIAASLDRLADRHAHRPDPGATYTPVRDDR